MPRVRPKKGGWRRKDAAMDAMRQLGFPPNLVKRKLNELLSTYGDDGWIFIEEASYKLLIELILEADQNEEQGESPTKLITYGNVAESSAGAALAYVPHNAHLDVADGPNLPPVNQVSAQSSDVGLNDKDNGDEGGTSSKLITNGDVAESSAGAAALADVPHNTRLDVADGPNLSPVNQVSAQSSDNKDSGDEGGTSSSSKEIIAGDHAQYAGTEHLRFADNVVLVFGASTGTGQANGMLETVRPKAVGTSGVDDPDEAPNIGNGRLSTVADIVASQIETDVKTSEVPCAQSYDQPIMRSPKRPYGWYDSSDDEDIVDVTQLTSYKLTSELLGGTKNAKESKRCWDLKPGTL